MKIALISGSYPPMKCGIGDYTSHLAAALANLDNQIDVLTSLPGGVGTQISGQVKIHSLVSQWNFKKLSAILEVIRYINPEIVNIQYPTQEYRRSLMINILPWLLKSRLGLPTVATIHEFSTFTILGRLRLAFTAKLSRKVIVTEHFNRKLLVQWAGSADKYTIIPLGANLLCEPPSNYNRDTLRSQLNIAPNSIVVAYFGFLSPSKGVDTLLKAFAEALKQNPNLYLLLVADRKASTGNYRAYYENIVQQVANFPYPDRLIWTGYLEPSDVSAHLLAADVAALPFTDGVSLRRTSLLAALIHGLPVISTIGSGTDTYGLNQDQGLYLVPAKNVQTLSVAILTLAKNSGLRTVLARRGQEFAGTFSWESIATQTLSVYEQAFKNQTFT